MSMDEFYTYVRTFNFVWASVVFITMCWWGSLDLVLTRRCKHLHVNKEQQLWAGSVAAGIAGLMIGLAEIFLSDAAGGFRVFVFMPMLALATWALVCGIKRVQQHRRDVEDGGCL